MDRIEKVLQRLTKKERAKVKETVAQLEAGSFKNLDIKKLKGRESVYRVRIGHLRVIYQMTSEGLSFLRIGRRNEKTYKNF